MNEIAPPILHVHRPSGGLDDVTGGPEDGKWYCCKCGSSEVIWIRQGDHPLGALACQCPHKPCATCNTTGLVKPFLPIEEPAIVPVSEVNKDILFGVICPHCGLSWRAKERGRHRKTLSKMPSLSIGSLRQNRLEPGKGRLRKARSTLIVGDRRIMTPPELGKQAEYAAVRFTGNECTCGQTIDLLALCFQIVTPAGRQKIWSTTSELEVKGHGELTLHLRGVSHPNPLCSAAISQEDIFIAQRLRQRYSM